MSTATTDDGLASLDLAVTVGGTKMTEPHDNPGGPPPPWFAQLRSDTVGLLNRA
jgi:hypothetical protein